MKFGNTVMLRLQVHDHVKQVLGLGLGVIGLVNITGHSHVTHVTGHVIDLR